MKGINRLHPFLSPNITEQDVFKVYSANYNEIWEINFLISCLPLLKNYLSDLKKYSAVSLLLTSNNLLE